MSKEIADLPESAPTRMLGDIPEADDGKHCAVVEMSDKHEKSLSLSWSETRDNSMLLNYNLWDVRDGASSPVEESVLGKEKHNLH
ncbi:hypothetical protein FNV43_RR06638 [Rhamnella rubrinervis]|uniref:Uncharacterized protein n=1 Tax=Rhamnella rubrinervis TaxID=2594499 RepID=A0A8K0HD82_9ROSA|nr:hypothetical protein FNV43_RR06052 [Rhamnella rubrinervis]KAF3450551.1 hypothetical protein FNV43_RR06638 [Rhamnella rubrinervis]